MPGAAERFGGSEKKVQKNLVSSNFRRNFAELFRLIKRKAVRPKGGAKKTEHIERVAIVTKQYKSYNGTPGSNAGDFEKNSVNFRKHNT